MQIYYSADEFNTLSASALVNDYFEKVLPKIADGSIQAVVIDPPYTDGNTDALPNHKIQTQIDINLIVREAYRVLQNDGFFVFFGQMPTAMAWLNAAFAVFKYREHITWAKRVLTSPYLDIQRCKEDIYIFAKGKPKYHEKQEKYEDLKTPAMHLGVYELSTFNTTISDLQRRCKDNAYNLLYFQGLNLPLNGGVTPCCGKKVVDNDITTVPMPKGQEENEFAEKAAAELDKLEGDIFTETATNDLCKSKKLVNAQTIVSDIQDFDDLERSVKIEMSHGKANDAWLEKKMLNAARERQAAKSENFEQLEKNQRETHPLSEHRNDTLMQNAFQKTLEKREEGFDENRAKVPHVGDKAPASNDENLNKGRELKTAHRYRSKHWCNVTNLWNFLPSPADAAVAEICTVWSYLSQNQTKMGANGENWKHPTVKPALLLKRLLKLLLPKPVEGQPAATVLDFFVGSGTTTMAAAELGYNFIGVELQPDYFAMTVARTKSALNGEKAVSKDMQAPSIAPETNPQTTLF